MTPAEDPGRDLAQWLLEVGRRRPVRGAADTPIRWEPARAAAQPARVLVKQTAMLAGLLAAYLQYFYLAVMVQIGALPTLVIYTPLQ